MQQVLIPIDELSISKIRQHCAGNEGGGVYLAFSGGKDSIVVYDLMQRAGVPFTAYYHLTTVDPPEIPRFIRQHYPDVVFVRPKDKEGRSTSMYAEIAKRGLPTCKCRWCCDIFKEGRGGGGGEKGQVVVLGIRAEESAKRAKRKMIEHHGGRIKFSPILHWKVSDIWEYIHSRALPYPNLYDEGFNRIGCLFCPMACIRQKNLEYLRYPKQASAYIRAIQTFLDTHPNSTLTKWGKDAEEIFLTWLYVTVPDDLKGQCTLFGGDSL